MLCPCPVSSHLDLLFLVNLHILCLYSCNATISNLMPFSTICCCFQLTTLRDELVIYILMLMCHTWVIFIALGDGREEIRPLPGIIIRLCLLIEKHNHL